MWLFMVTIGLMSIDYGVGLNTYRELPCKFLDSINITDGVMQSDKSIIFDETKYTMNQYSRINYILDNETQHIPVEPYLRGCLCNIKPCIRLCCPYGSIHVNANGEKGCRKHDVAHQFESEIHAENSNVKALLENHAFGYVDDRPCSKFYLAENYTMTNVISSKAYSLEQKPNSNRIDNIYTKMHIHHFRRDMYYLKINRYHIVIIA